MSYDFHPFVKPTNKGKNIQICQDLVQQAEADTGEESDVIGENHEIIE